MAGRWSGRHSGGLTAAAAYSYRVKLLQISFFVVEAIMEPSLKMAKEEKKNHFKKLNSMNIFYSDVKFGNQLRFIIKAESVLLNLVLMPKFVVPIEVSIEAAS
ncbi:hypothetical protein ACH5RR_014914 [Cinchona calisaya]|uniref:Uncharacterized protein n=1 Tax=Cinchona calisaya TaxID=153742 RepID=A0ABD2ZRM7_9GENT